MIFGNIRNMKEMIQQRDVDEAAVDHTKSQSVLGKFEDAQRNIAELDQRIQELSSVGDEGASLRIKSERERVHLEYERLTQEIVRELFERDRDARARYETLRTQLFSADELLKMEKQIEDIYGKKPLWHGTGRFRYAFQGASKYRGIDYRAEKVDVLKSILQTGLQPQYDPWGVAASGRPATLSLTEQRMLARVVAEARLPEGEELQYEFGTSRFWWLLLMKKEGLENLMIHKDALSAVRTSMSELNNKILEEYSGNYVDAYTETRSTITGNYPVIFCVNSEMVQVKKLQNVAVSTNFEQRATVGSGLESISHIEVPIQNVRETQELLQSLGIDLAVIPIEEWERWMGRLSEKIYQDTLQRDA